MQLNPVSIDAVFNSVHIIDIVIQTEPSTPVEAYADRPWESPGSTA